MPAVQGRARPSGPQTWIFVFDHRHLLPGGFKRAHAALRAFIAERFRAGDLAGIVDRDRMVNNRLTSVRQEVLDAIEKVKVPGDQLSREKDGGAAAAVPAGDAVDAHIADVLKSMTAAEQVRAARGSLETLDELVTKLAAVQGPKTIVYFSGGCGLVDVEGTLRTVVGKATRAGARVYPIDARGLAGGPADTLNSLAADTGGMVIFNENNVGRALDAIAADTNLYYVLGYQPLNTKYDGKFRPIDVRVKRPGAKVRARKGYLAIDPRNMAVPQPIR